MMMMRLEKGMDGCVMGDIYYISTCLPVIFYLFNGFVLLISVSFFLVCGGFLSLFFPFPSLGRVIDELPPPSHSRSHLHCLLDASQSAGSVVVVVIFNRSCISSLLRRGFAHLFFVLPPCFGRCFLWFCFRRSFCLLLCLAGTNDRF